MRTFAHLTHHNSGKFVVGKWTHISKNIFVQPSHWYHECAVCQEHWLGWAELLLLFLGKCVSTAKWNPWQAYMQYNLVWWEDQAVWIGYSRQITITWASMFVDVIALPQTLGFFCIQQYSLQAWCKENLTEQRQKRYPRVACFREQQKREQCYSEKSECLVQTLLYSREIFKLRLRTIP